MVDANYVFLLSLTVILIGFLVKKIGILNEEHGKNIAKVILNITLPALILDVFSEIEISPVLLLLPLLALFYSAIVLGISFLVFRTTSLTQKGIFLMTSIGFNIGLFAYPMVEAIWGAQGMEYLIMFDLGNSFVVFVFAYTVGFIYSPDLKPEKKQLEIKDVLKNILKSVPLIILLIAITLNITGIILPIFIKDLLNILSRANMALTLLILGIFINIDFEKENWKNIVKVLVLRYGLGLIAGIIVFLVLPFELIYNAVIFIALILPIGMSAIPFSVEFGYNERVASTLVNLTNIISFFLMWLIVSLLGIS
ncbi:MAG: Membrane transport protein [Promethearchaeota archaeon]|nr:MAG: Membrane transport protein [Candidatus Lokiarchaeota archaeon]